MSGGLSRRLRRGAILTGVAAAAGFAFSASALAGSAGWPFDPRTLGAGDSASVVDVQAVTAALDTLESARWAFVAGMLRGSLQELRRVSDARERAGLALSYSLGNPVLVHTLSWTDRTRWLELALSEGRRDWTRPLLRSWGRELPPSGDSLRGSAALALGLAALGLLEEDPEEESAFLDPELGGSLDSVAVRSLRAAAGEQFLLRDEAFHRLEVLAEAEGDTATALASADSIVLLFPDSPRSPDARTIRARALLAAGRPKEAREEALLGLALQTTPELRWLVARASLAAGDSTEATRELEALIIASPLHPLAAAAWKLRGELTKGDSTSAGGGVTEVELLGALLSNPLANAEASLVAMTEHPGVSPSVRTEASIALGKYEYRRKAYEAAEARFVHLEGTAAEPGAVEEARLYLARIYRNTGRTEPMAIAYRSLFEQPGEKAALAAWELGREWESLGRWADAEAVYTELLESQPASARRRDALFRRGFDRERQGKLALALADFHSARRGSLSRPDEEQAAYWAARTLAALGRGREAVTLARQTAGSAPPAGAYGVLLRERFSLPDPVRRTLPTTADTMGGPVPSPPRFSGASTLARRAGERGMALLRLGITDAARRELRSGATVRSAAVGEGFVQIAAAYDLYPEGVHWAARALEASPGRALSKERLRRLVYPAAYAGQVVPEATRHGLDPATVWALMRQESLYDARAVSRAGARGLMQVMPTTLARMSAEGGVPAPSADVLFYPASNIAFGTQFLAERLAEFGNCLLPTLASYNAGEGKAREWLERAGGDSEEVFLECIGYAETSDYVRRIVWLRWLYHTLYEGERGRSASRE